MMTARWLLDHNPDPAEGEIREAISGQLCRCTGYENIVRSVRWAAEHPRRAARRCRHDAPTDRPAERRPATRSASAACSRKEDARFLRGQGQLRRRHRSCPACCTARSCAARYAHARIVSIDTSAAEAHPKVQGGHHRRACSRRWTWPGCRRCPHDVQAVLATDKVRFQGQEVAFVVAEDRYSARDALELIEVEYEPLPPVVDAKRALDPDAPVIRDDIEGKTDNHIFDWEAGDKAATDAVFAAADVVVTPGHALPARAPGADGDLRRGRRHGPGHRQAHDLVHDPGAARPPHALRAGRRPARAQDPDHLARTSAAGSATRSAIYPGLRAARSSARSSPASR